MNRLVTLLSLFTGAICQWAPAHAQVSGPPAFAGIATPAPATPQKAFEALKDPTPLPNSAFVRYFTTDELGRTIVFYADQPPPTPGKPDEKLPVVLFVQGSGSQSVFTRMEKGDTVRASPSGGQGTVRDAAKGRAIVVIAEKPGVKFMEQPSRPGGGQEGSQEFREEHTLPRWSTAVSAALKAALTLPRADPTRVLVVGHSEGGLVACSVAAHNPFVTHVATLAGGGATQLFDLIELARRGDLCGSGGADPEECVQRLLAMWDDVLKSPDSADAFFLGHPHRRWTSFLATSPLEELKLTTAKVFIGQGLDDKAVFPASADVLFASLKASGRDVTYSRVPGDHGFMTHGQDGKIKPEGWDQMHARVLDWFLEISNAPSNPSAPK
jgi:dienelactone hydrolase